MNRPLLASLVVFCFVLLALERPAAAYLDPGTGSMVFQVVVAALLTGLFAIRTFWSRVRLAAVSLFRRRRRDDERQ